MGLKMSVHYRAKILVVDDDEANLLAVQKILEQEAYEVVLAKDGQAGLAQFKRINFDLVISDLRMPVMGGLDLLKAIRSINQECPVLLLTAFGTVDDAVEAMKLGARDFINKPIRKAILLKLIEDSLSRIQSKNFGDSSLDKLMGQSAAINEIKRTIQMVAPSDAPVLISGESGTGKELVAKAIHEASGRSGKIVCINCSAIPESLLESELFGYAKGAFTGALSEKIGLFEEAAGGTIFLDEIGDMPIGLQSKLLRTLEDKLVRRIGGTTDKPVNFRIIAATNANLQSKIESGQFRSDLFYRLNVIRIHIPALRDRQGDASILAKIFFERARGRSGKKNLELSASAMAAIAKHDWPGNVRELKNCIERAVVLCRDILINELDLHLTAMRPPKVETVLDSDKLSFDIGTKLEDIEREVIRKTLSHYGGDKRKTAEVLGINLRTIYRKIDAGL